MRVGRGSGSPELATAPLAARSVRHPQQTKLFGGVLVQAGALLINHIAPRRRTLAENPWMEVPMTAVAQHLPPRPKPVPNAPGMFAFADPEHVTEVFAAAGWAQPRFEKLDMDLDIAAGRGLEEAVVQSTEIGAVNSWLRNQPAQVISAVVASLREALAPYADGVSVRLRGAMWLISSAPA